MGITEKDMTNDKIYLHAVTLATEVLSYILTDDNMHKLYEFIQGDCGLVREMVNKCVDVVSEKIEIKKLVYEKSQEEYMKKFSRLFVGALTVCTNQFKKLSDKRDLYKKNGLLLAETVGGYAFETLKMFDNEYTKEHGKIKEDTPILLFG